MKPCAEPQLVHLEARRSTREQLVADALEGLSARPKHLPPRWFYDERGSNLFDRITRLPEYYLTRAETEILERSADSIVADVRPTEILELGSGYSRKTQLLLEAMHRCGSGDRYVPLDVSEDALRSASTRLVARYPWLCVQGVVGDFEQHLRQVPRGGRRLVAFLGSTVGNLDPAERARFLGDVQGMLEDSDRLLLGVDLVKDAGTLHAAYNDAERVTDAFNLNVLTVLNRELDGDIPVDAFEHVARFIPERSRIEMSLRAKRPVVARLASVDLVTTFAAGEEMLTEISCKFTREGIAAELATAGLALERWEEDGLGRFALLLAGPAR